MLDKWEGGNKKENELSTSFRKQIFALMEVKRGEEIVGSVNDILWNTWNICLVCLFFATLILASTYEYPVHS